MAHAAFAVGVHAFAERRPHEGIQQRHAAALAHGPRIEGIAAPRRLADGVAEVTPVVKPQRPRFPRRVLEDVEPLGAGGRHAPHHHRQHWAQRQLDAGRGGEIHRGGEDERCVWASDGRIELQRQGAVVLERPGFDGGPRRQRPLGALVRAKVVKPVLQVIQAIHPPVPLLAVVEHGAGVVAEGLAPLRSGGHLGARGCRVRGGMTLRQRLQIPF